MCKIKGLCSQPQIALVQAGNQNETRDNPKEEEKTIPKDLVINFAFDKSGFESGVESNEYVEQSNAYFLHNAQAILRITGHTDSVGTIEYNQALGMRRAQAIENYFKIKGIPEDKMQIDSKGENMPADNNNTREGRANNRRAVVTIKK